MKLFYSICLVCLTTTSIFAADKWVVDSQEDWEKNTDSKENITFKDGEADPSAKTATIKSTIKKFDKKQSAASITIKQSDIWQNWKGIPNLGPANMADAPVMLNIGPNNYWLFGRYSSGGKKKKPKKNTNKSDKKQPDAGDDTIAGKDVKLEGWDIPLKTTKWPNQYDAPGGLVKGKGGYHAWQSKDMKNWVHHGAVTEGFSRWVTTAEYVDGKLYIYYDFPNDQDPHLYIDDNWTDGKPGKNMGIAFKDPSHGSDSAVIRDLQGKFHVIYEDWSPINASKRSWDSPLAGHAVSEDGKGNFKIVDPAVDNRTKDTGKIATYKHPH